MAARQDASTGEIVEEPLAEAELDKSTARDDQLKVKVWSPFHVYYDGQAKSISGVNGTGPFDILPRHHNFITLLNSSDLVMQTEDEGEVKIRISGGIMQVHHDAVTVYLEA